MAEIEGGYWDARIWLFNIDGFFIPLVGLLKWRKRTTKHCVLRLGLFFFYFTSPFYEKTPEIPLKNEVGKISDFNTYEQRYGF